MKIKCSHDLYDGDVIADKWYDVTEFEDNIYNFIDEDGFELTVIIDGGCAHLADISGAFWTVSA